MERMKIKDAVKQIGFRFSGALKKANEDKDKKKPPVLYLNEKDVQAIKRIGEYVEQKEQEQFHDHELFAKLFIFTYKRLFEIEGGNILDNGMTAKRRKIYNLLDKSVPQLIQEFTQMLNDSEQYTLLDAVQGKISHPAELSDEKRVSNAEKLQEALKTPENKSKLLGEVWDFDTVASALESEVNQAIELYNN